MDRLYCVILTVVSFSQWDIALSKGRKLHDEPFRSRPLLEADSIRVQSNILYRYATTTVTVTLKNDNPEERVAAAPMWVPDGAYVTSASMRVNGSVYQGQLQKRDAPGKQKKPLKVKLEAANFLQWTETEYLQLTWPTPPNTEVTYNVTYEQLLAMKYSEYSHVIYLGPGMRARDVMVEVNIRESQRINYLSAFFEDTNGHIKSSSELIQVNRLGNKKGRIVCRPTGIPGQNGTQLPLPGKLRLQYQLRREGLLGSMLVEQDYFIHFFSPSGLPAIPRKLVYLLDVSVSMVGEKLTGMKQAVFASLDSLRPADKFNIVTFSSGLRQLREDGLVPANEDTVLQGKRFLETATAGGGTNINHALLRGLSLLTHDRYDGHVCAPIIFFLTDGPPTSGITSPDVILSNIRKHNQARISIYSVGLGGAADVAFLRRLALQNGGEFRNIPEASTTGTKLAEFLRSFEAPIMANVRFQYTKYAVDYDSLSRYDYNVLYNGTELTVSGKILPHHTKKISTNIYGTPSSGSVNIEQSFNRQAFHNRDKGSIPRAWAWLKYRTEHAYMVKAANSTIKERLKHKAVDLALRNSLLTPLTTLYVRAPGTDKNILWFKDQDKNYDRVLKKTETTVPLTNKRQRHKKTDGKISFVDNDPHFVVRLRGLDLPVCFDIGGNHGDIFQLIHDPTTGISVNGRVMMVRDNEDKKKTYFDRISIISPDDKVTVSLSRIIVNTEPVAWGRSDAKDTENSLIYVSAWKNVTITLAGDVMLAVLRHHNKKQNELEYLGFYIIEGQGFSSVTHGLIGQFLNKHGKIKIPEKNPDPTVAKLAIRGPRVAPYSVKAKLRRRRNMALKQHVPCWHVGGNAHGLVEGEYTDYLVSRLSYRGQNKVEKRTRETKPDKSKRTWIKDDSEIIEI